MPNDPDASIVALFRDHPNPNPSKSAEAGRPIFDDMEVCELRYPGSRSVGVYPATAISFWKDDPMTGEQTPVTYAERFPRQYQQFKMQSTQTKAGTPLQYCPFLTEARRAELRAQNIYTAEALAAIDGQPLKNLGPGGREMKNKAIEYLEETKAAAPNTTALAAELEAIKARNAILEEDAKLVKDRGGADPDDIFEDMSIDQLREYITANTGIAPHGSITRKTLMRMASDARKNVKAA